jgi:hypothetical protein
MPAELTEAGSQEVEAPGRLGVWLFGLGFCDQTSEIGDVSGDVRDERL